MRLATASSAANRAPKRQPSPTSVRTGKVSSITSMAPAETPISTTITGVTLPCTCHEARTSPPSSSQMWTGRPTRWLARSSHQSTTWPRASGTRRMVVDATHTAPLAMVASRILTVSSLSTRGSSSPATSAATNKMATIWREGTSECKWKSRCATFPTSSALQLKTTRKAERRNRVINIQRRRLPGTNRTRWIIDWRPSSCNRTTLWWRVNFCVERVACDTINQVWWQWIGILVEWSAPTTKRSSMRWSSAKHSKGRIKRGLSLSELIPWSTCSCKSRWIRWRSLLIFLRRSVTCEQVTFN